MFTQFRYQARNGMRLSGKGEIVKSTGQSNFIQVVGAIVEVPKEYCQNINTIRETSNSAVGV